MNKELIAFQLDFILVQRSGRRTGNYLAVYIEKSGVAWTIEFAFLLIPVHSAAEMSADI